MWNKAISMEDINRLKVVLVEKSVPFAGANKVNKENMATKVIKEKAIEEALWESANKLRG